MKVAISSGQGATKAKSRHGCRGLLGFALLSVFLVIGGCQKEKAVEHKTVRFTTWGSPASNKVYQDVVNEFKRKNPGIKADLMMLPWSDYHRNILTMFAAGRLRDAERILICGPGEAKFELEKEIKKSKELSARIVGIKPADKMTERQILAKVKVFFASSV